MSPGADNFPEFFADSPAQRIQWLSTRTFRLFFAVTFVWFIPIGNQEVFGEELCWQHRMPVGLRSGIFFGLHVVSLLENLRQ